MPIFQSKWMERCTIAKASCIAMRVSMAINLAIGVLLIYAGCKLENPPQHYPSIFFIVMGCATLCAIPFGLWGSYHKKRILAIYLIIQGFSTLMQLIVFIILLANFEKALNVIVTKSAVSESEYDSVRNTLNLSRWLLLVCLFFEAFMLTMAVLLKWVIKEDDMVYHGFDTDESEKRALTLGTIASDIESGAKRSKSEKQYDKIREKMQSKYGATSGGGGGGDWKSKTKGILSTAG